MANYSELLNYFNQFLLSVHTLADRGFANHLQDELRSYWIKEGDGDCAKSIADLKTKIEKVLDFQSGKALVFMHYNGEHPTARSVVNCCNTLKSKM